MIGKKIGVTSKPVQDMLDVHQPDFGFLTDSMRYADGATVSLADAGLIQPRAEGEIAFVLKRDLHGPGVTARDVLAATECVMPCFEIVDSRIDDWKIRIQDTVADNASCGVFVLGASAADPRALDLAAARMELWRERRSSPAAAWARPCRASGRPRWRGWPTRWARFGIPFAGRRGDPVRLAGAAGAGVRRRPLSRCRSAASAAAR